MRKKKLANLRNKKLKSLVDSECPRLLFSACLGFETNFANDSNNMFTQSLSALRWQSGLGIHRDPIRITYHEGYFRLIQPATGKDLTELVHRFASEFLLKLSSVDGFVLKSRSPSCGIDVKKTF